MTTALRKELVQVAAVAIAMVTDLEWGSTSLDWPTAAYEEVYEERKRQERLHGERHYPVERWFAVLAEEVGEAANEAPPNPGVWHWHDLRYLLQRAELTGRRLQDHEGALEEHENAKA